MSWYDILKIIIAIFGSIGGAGAIILGLSGWLGKVWADRFLEQEKAKYQKEIEQYKNQLEELKTNSLRYSGKQFDLYNQLWKSLCDLEDIADMLWEKAQTHNLEQFLSNLIKVKKEIKESRLFLEDNHYNQLLEIFKKFENYKIGKQKLLELGQTEDNPITATAIQDLITNNFLYRDNYKKIINEIGNNFKKQLRGNK
jgi:hypothetical protein